MSAGLLAVRTNKSAGHVGKSCNCLEKVSLTFEEVLVGLVVFIKMLYCNGILPFGQADILETLFQT
jgi:hypothetical protein